jgi:plasmid stabilization system protein ParE
MNFKVIVMPQAERHIQEDFDWWAENRSPEQARRWYQACKRAINALSRNPRRRPRWREGLDLSYELREIYFGASRKVTHRAVFLIEEDTVVVLAVRHLAQQDLTLRDLGIE